VTGPSQGWGIIRYAAGSGLTPEDDCAAFDGWYADREEAVAVYHDMCKRCPHSIVALVQAHETKCDSAIPRGRMFLRLI
jgi:hypothetical protein